MKALALLTIALISTSSNATTFLACVGDSKTEFKFRDNTKHNTSEKDVKFQVEFDNFEGAGSVKVAGGLSTPPLKSCTFTNDWIECKETFFMSSKLGETTQLGVTQQSTSTFKYETKLKLNRKTGLGEYTTTNDTKTTEPIEKAGTYYTYESAKFLCKPANKNQF